MYQVALKQFEGPLDLLLKLIEGEELNVSEVSLAHVTDSYLKHLDEHPEIPPQELADFLVIASKLLLIKSRILLPFLEAVSEEEEEGQSLEAQLVIYKEYVEASKRLDELLGKRRILYVHDKLPQVEIGFAPPKKLTPDSMASLYLGVLERLNPVVKTPRVVVERTVSIHEKITHIRSMISRASKMRFSDILSTAESRTEVVVSFLALLELVKQRNVAVSQDSRYGDIVIEQFAPDKA